MYGNTQRKHFKDATLLIIFSQPLTLWIQKIVVPDQDTDYLSGGNALGGN